MASKVSALKNVDGSKLNVIQEGHLGDPPEIKPDRTENLTADEQDMKEAFIACLKKHLQPQKTNLRSLPEHDKQALYRKLDKIEFAVLRRFFADISADALDAILKGDIENLDPSAIAELNYKYRDISP